MTLDTKKMFMELHAGLPRQSCGSVESTYRALSLIKTRLPGSPLIADMGCGPGSSVIPLAKAMTDARFIALDLYPPFVEAAKSRAVSQGCDERIDARVGDMLRPPTPPHSLDLIWCEGAIYNIGVEAGLRAWTKHLKQGGVIVFNEPIWLTPPADRSRELTDFWSAYPDMTDDGGVRSAITRSGFDVIDSFDLPENDWWDEYYDPLEKNLALLETKYADLPEANAVLENTRTEISMRRQHAAHYNYRFYCIRQV